LGDPGWGFTAETQRGAEVSRRKPRAESEVESGAKIEEGAAGSGVCGGSEMGCGNEAKFSEVHSGSMGCGPGSGAGRLWSAFRLRW
jgi:hypothetical protein